MLSENRKIHKQYLFTQPDIQNPPVPPSTFLGSQPTVKYDPVLLSRPENRFSGRDSGFCPPVRGMKGDMTTNSLQKLAH